MPRYFFDIEDDAASMRDEEGSVLPDLASAQHEATETLVQMGRDAFRSRDHGTLSVAIRDEAGATLSTQRLTLTVDTG